MTTHSTPPKPLALVIDDDVTIRLLIQKSLESVQIEALLAPDIATGKDILNTSRPNIILLDVELPDGNGFELCRQLHEDNHFSDIPIIMVTSHDDPESVENSYRSGAIDYFAKPINWTVLGKRTHYALRANKAFSDLRASQAHNLAVLNAMPDSVGIVDRNGILLNIRPGQDDEHMRNAETHIGNEASGLLPPAAHYIFKQALEETFTANTTQTRDYDFNYKGRNIHYEARMAAIDQQQLVVMFRNITDRVDSERRMRHLAYYDSLTGLPNRRYFLERFNNVLARAKRDHTKAAVLFIDLDRFKRINDSLGHSVGDEILIAVADRLRETIRDDEILSQGTTNNIARLGGDEFTVIINHFESTEQIEPSICRLIENLSKPMILKDRQLVVTPSIGISGYPDDGENVESMLRNADTAMYKAKSSGRNNFQFYGRDMSENTMKQFEMENQLRGAVQRKEIVLFYQPQFELKTQTIIGFEALARWHNPKLGPVQPSEFIPLAEESGMIIEIGRYVLEMACLQINKWNEQGYTGVRVAVNVSGLQFQRHQIVSDVANLLAKYNIQRHQLELEVTEGVIMKDIDQSVETLSALKDIGVRLSVDDFGMGYSSLGYLKKLPLDILKIDKSFVEDLQHSDEDRSIVDAIIALAHRLGLKVIAEGVETQHQLDYLSLKDCEYVQGYLFGKPESETTSSELLSHEWRAARRIQSN